MTASFESIAKNFGHELANRDLGSTKLTVRAISSAAFSLADALTVNTPEKTKGKESTRLAHVVIAAFNEMADRWEIETFKERYESEKTNVDMIPCRDIIDVLNRRVNFHGRQFEEGVEHSKVYHMNAKRELQYLLGRFTAHGAGIRTFTSK